MTRMTVNELNALKVGDRVAFPHGAEAYPAFLFNDRLTGTVCENDPGDMLCVKIDQHKDELDDWQNVIQVTLYSDDELAHHVERLFTSAYDAEDKLGEFIRQYCAKRGITVDGDAFGMMFSEDREWTESEAAAVIEDAARIYGLRT